MTSRRSRVCAVFGVPLLLAAGVVLAVPSPTPSEAGDDPGPSVVEAPDPRHGGGSSARLRASGPPEPAPARWPSPSPPSAPPASTSPERGPYEVTMVRAAGALDEGLQRALGDVPGVRATSAVHAGQVRLTGVSGSDGRPVAEHADGWAVPLDVLGVDPATFPPLLAGTDRGPFEDLRADQALLSETSARVLGVEAGATLRVTGADLRIVDVVPDGLVGTVEAVVEPATARRLGLRVQYLLAGAEPGDLAAADDVAALALPAPATLAERLGRSPWPASWREVLPLAKVKERFGTFAYRPAGGRSIAQDPEWAAAHLERATVPLLGEVRCHRAILEPLADALSELEASGLGYLVDAGDYAGCHSARLMSPGGPVSRHAWGLAVDLNAAANPFGFPPTQDPRLVEVMDRHGFGYGGRWPTPDGMHFEYRGR
ncbi:hypothetical protein BH23ACT8_BH23ACT8_12920 [soil metagenome]